MVDLNYWDGLVRKRYLFIFAGIHFGSAVVTGPISITNDIMDMTVIPHRYNKYFSLGDIWTKRISEMQRNGKRRREKSKCVTLARTKATSLEKIRNLKGRLHVDSTLLYSLCNGIPNSTRSRLMIKWEKKMISCGTWGYREATLLVRDHPGMLLNCLANPMLKRSLR